MVVSPASGGSRAFSLGATDGRGTIAAVLEDAGLTPVDMWPAVVSNAAVGVLSGQEMIRGSIARGHRARREPDPEHRERYASGNSAAHLADVGAADDLASRTTRSSHCGATPGTAPAASRRATRADEVWSSGSGPRSTAVAVSRSRDGPRMEMRVSRSSSSRCGTGSGRGVAPGACSGSRGDPAAGDFGGVERTRRMVLAPGSRTGGSHRNRVVKRLVRTLQSGPGSGAGATGVAPEALAEPGIPRRSTLAERMRRPRQDGAPARTGTEPGFAMAVRVQRPEAGLSAQLAASRWAVPLRRGLVPPGSYGVRTQRFT